MGARKEKEMLPNAKERAKRFQKGRKLGGGTFGDVTKAVDTYSGEEVALKKVRIVNASEGISITALREMKTLKELSHPNIAKLVDVYMQKRNLVLALEYLPSDLEAVIKERSLSLGTARIKAYLSMALESLECIHSRYFAHRDIKPNNFLIAHNGTLKLADFGLARAIGSPDVRMTTQVHMRWYRAPELLLGARHYSTSVDMWALGCILAEMLQRRPWIVGNSDIEQLQLIFDRRGTPDAVGWNAAKLLPTYVEPKHRIQPKELKQMLPQASASALSMLDWLVQLDPLKRPSASQCLQSTFLRAEPVPEDVSTMPVPSVSTAARTTAPAASGEEEQDGDGHADAAGIAPATERQEARQEKKRKKRKRHVGEHTKADQLDEDVVQCVGEDEENGDVNMQQQEEEAGNGNQAYAGDGNTASTEREDAYPATVEPASKAPRYVADGTPANAACQSSILGTGGLGTMPHTGAPTTAGTAGTTGNEKAAGEASPPGLSSVDRQYLRKRKQAVDEALGLASAQNGDGADDD